MKKRAVFKSLLTGIVGSYLMSSTLVMGAPLLNEATGSAAIQKEVHNQYKGNGCELSVNPRSGSVRAAVSADKTAIAVHVIVEGCGGGNNWGSFVGLARVDPQGRVSVKIEPLKGILEHLSFDADGSLDALIKTYGPDDPRCCPSKNLRVHFKNNPVSTVPVSVGGTVLMEGSGWDNLIGKSFGKKDCMSSFEFSKVLSSFMTPTKTSSFALAKNPKLPLGMALERASTLQNKDDHSVISIYPKEAHLMGLPIERIDAGVGHDNGIGFHTFVVAQPITSTLSSLTRLGLKKSKQQNGHTSYTHEYPDDGVPISLTLIEENSKSILVCDHSN